MGEVVYIIAVALQLAGALVLIRSFENIKLKNAVAKELNESETAIHWNNHEDDGSTSVTYSPEEQQKAAVRVIQNRIAFIYIAVGYAAGVIGDRGNKCVDFFAVLVLGAVFMALCGLIAKSISKRRFSKPMKVVDSNDTF